MKKISFWGKEIEYDSQQSYLSIGDIGSTHGGAVRGKYDNPHLRLEKDAKVVKDLESLLILHIEIQIDLWDVITIVRTGDCAGITTLLDGEREQYMNTIALYVRALETITDLYEENNLQKKATEIRGNIAEIKKEFQL